MSWLEIMQSQNCREARHATLEIKTTSDSGARDLLRGAMVNALSPHPWIFWLGVGAVKVVEVSVGQQYHVDRGQIGR